MQKVAWSSQTLTVGTLSSTTEVHHYPLSQEPLSYGKKARYYNITIPRNSYRGLCCSQVLIHCSTIAQVAKPFTVGVTWLYTNKTYLHELIDRVEEVHNGSRSGHTDPEQVKCLNWGHYWNCWHVWWWISFSRPAHINLFSSIHGSVCIMLFCSKFMSRTIQLHNRTSNHLLCNLGPRKN